MARSSLSAGRCRWVLRRLRARVDREGLFRGSGPVGVAVSGGADSLALLHGLRTLYPRTGIVAVHLNHCLRGEASDADERFVRDSARDLGCRAIARRVDVGARARVSGENLEEAGRRARYEFFADLLRLGTCGVIATGHTRSDQAETLLFRLLRGAGGTGLSAILPVRSDGIVRPMLDIARADVVAYLRANGIAWREDSSNADDGFARNRIRHRLLPQLRREWNPAIEAVLANTADRALEEERYWIREVARIRRKCVTETAHGTVLDVARVRALHTAAQRRLLHALAQELGSAPSFGHVESLRGLVGQRRGSGIAHLPGLVAQRSFGSVLLRARPLAEMPDYDMRVPVPGALTLPVSGWGALRTAVHPPADARSLYNQQQVALLDWDRVPKPLRARGWRPGDRLTPVERDAPRKIKDLFHKHRVSAWSRAGWPVVAGGRGADRVVWTGRFGSDAEFRVQRDSRRVLVIGTENPAGPNLVPAASKQRGGPSAAKD